MSRESHGQSSGRSLTRSVASGFAAAVFVLIGLGLVAYASLQRFTRDASRTMHTQEVFACVAELEMTLVDLERGARGFVITGEDEYLTPYGAALHNIGPRFERLSRLTAGSTSEQDRLERLRRLIDRKTQVTQSKIDLRRTAGFDATRESSLIR